MSTQQISPFINIYGLELQFGISIDCLIIDLFDKCGHILNCHFEKRTTDRTRILNYFSLNTSKVN